MTKQEFLDRYQRYSTQDREAAMREASKANQEGIEGGEAVCVSLPPLGYCVMLRSAADLLGLDYTESQAGK